MPNDFCIQTLAPNRVQVPLIIELTCGGADGGTNLWPLTATVNGMNADTVEEIYLQRF